jgi:hypothetical protein
MRRHAMGQVFKAYWPTGLISACFSWLVYTEKEETQPEKIIIKEEIENVEWNKFTEEQKLFIRNHPNMQFNHKQWMNLALMINWQTQPGWPATKE